MRNMFRLAVILAVVCAFPLSAGAAGLKIGFVDVQTVLVNSKTGKAATNQLKAAFAAQEKKIDEKGRALQLLEKDIVSQRGIVSNDKLMKKQADFNKKLTAFQKSMQKYQQDRAQKEKALMQPLFKKFNKVVTAFAQDNGYDIIFDVKTAAYAKQTMDLTKQITAKFDQTK